LDHYLPSSKFPEFALFPLNLVPLCGGCNGKKSAKVPTLRPHSFLHPYFDAIPDVAIHAVDLNFVGGSLTATFAFNRLNIVDKSLAARMENQFISMDVNYQISFEVETILREITDTLDEDYNDAEGAQVSAYLSKVADRLSRTFNHAYWKVALYRALAADSQFCDGGWKTLAVPETNPV
jgi:hypothetical protein